METEKISSFPLVVVIEFKIQFRAYNFKSFQQTVINSLKTAPGKIKDFALFSSYQAKF